MPQWRRRGKLNAGRAGHRCRQPAPAADVLGDVGGLHRRKPEKSMHKTLSVTTLALALASGLAFARQDEPADREAARAEWRARAEARWAASDKDGDGSLDRVEAQAHHPRLAERFDRIDADGDGEISREEMRAMHGRMHQGRRGMHRMQGYMAGLFVGMDDDRNGAISRSELGDKAPRIAENFAAIDKDGNGELDKEEFREHHRSQRAARRAKPAD